MMFNPPENPSQLATDIENSISHLSEQVDIGDAPADGPAAMGPEQALGMFKPMLRTWATDDEQAAIQALAVLHLETGALLAKHRPDEDPETLV